MTRLAAPNGWSISRDTDHLIELTRDIDKGAYSKEVIRAEKNPKTGNWSLDIYETDTQDSRRDEIRSRAEPADDKPDIIDLINDYTQTAARGQY